MPTRRCQRLTSKPPFCTKPVLMRKLSFLSLALVIALSAGVPTSGRAQTYTLITNQAAFNLAANYPTAFTFQGYTPGTGETGYAAGPLSVDGVTFTDPTHQNLAVFSPSYLSEADFTTDYLVGGGSTITITLPPGTTAFGAHFASYVNSGTHDLLALTINGAATTPATVQIAGYASSTSTFAGVVSSTPFTTVVITDESNNAIAIDNVQVAPEPSTWALLGVGIAGLGLTLRRRPARVSFSDSRRCITRNHPPTFRPLRNVAKLSTSFHSL